MVAPWALRRLGDLATPLEVAIAQAMTKTHQDSAAAQDHSGTSRRDPYGHTRKRRQFETLVQFTAEIEGCSPVHPRGAAYDLVHLVEQRLVLFPWHFAADGARPIKQARFRMSKLLEDLLTGPEDPDPQLTTDDIDLSTEELDARYTEESEVAEELRSWGAFVLVGFASNPHRLHRVGWGVGHIGDPSTGEVQWEEPWTEISVEQVLRAHPIPDGALLRPVGSGQAAPSGDWFGAGTPEDLDLSAKTSGPGEADNR